MNVCPNCGRDAETDVRYCSNCGYDLLPTDTLKTKKIDSTDLSRSILKIGSRIQNRFHIISKIGTGGTGIVYKAHDTVLDEVVALKVLKPELALDDTMISRFKREIKIARKIKHPNICSIYNYGSFKRIFFISMQFIEGTNLSLLISEEQLNMDQKMLIVRGILGGLNAAHQDDIIHRDLKPSNILVDYQFRPVISDFGLARHIGPTKITLPEEILGTPSYMPPETFKGHAIDQRSDIYSLGIILYELYTRKLPFNADTPVSLAMQHIDESPPPPRNFNEELSESLEKIILKCLEKDPRNRYQTVPELIDDLDDKPLELQPRPKREKILIADDEEHIEN